MIYQSALTIQYIETKNCVCPVKMFTHQILVPKDFWQSPTQNQGNRNTYQATHGDLNYVRWNFPQRST